MGGIFIFGGLLFVNVYKVFIVVKVIGVVNSITLTTSTSIKK